MSRFLIDELALRWVVTVLFGLSAAGYVYILVAQHGRWTSAVNHLLHLVMSVAMIVMAWPVGMDFPTVGPMIFFLLAAFWFLLVAGRVSSGTPDRLTNGYNAVMMTAMAWMYAVMNGRLSVQTGHSSDQTLSGSPWAEMRGIDTSVHDMSWTAPEPGWITAGEADTITRGLMDTLSKDRTLAGRLKRSLVNARRLAEAELDPQKFAALDWPTDLRNHRPAPGRT